MAEIQQQKIIIVSAMHGRQNTVQKCLDLLPNIEKVYIYSDDVDGEFLKRNNIECHKIPNEPLSDKWAYAIHKLKRKEFDGVILLGSDDYVDECFVEFVKAHISNYDLISFKDIYFDKRGVKYYWKGYEGSRSGEPAGAGKTYSKEFLERINYDLFPKSRNYSLDGMSWKVVQDNRAKVLVTSLKENNLMLCDIKDGKGMTKLNSIKNIVRCI